MSESQIRNPDSEAAGIESHADPSQPTAGGSPGPRVRIGAILALAVAVGFVAWVAIGGGGDNTSPPTSVPAPGAKGTGPVALSSRGLRTLAAALNQPIYWLGPERGMLYELTRTDDGKVYIRYLPTGVEAGSKRTLLTVGTYPMQDAYQRTKAASEGNGSTPLRVGAGTAGFSGTGSITNAYVAFSGTDYQVEVYSPTPGLARRLVQHGAVNRVP